MPPIHARIRRLTELVDEVGFHAPLNREVHPIFISRLRAQSARQSVVILIPHLNIFLNSSKRVMDSLAQ
jgi:hypothetical protein